MVSSYNQRTDTSAIFTDEMTRATFWHYIRTILKQELVYEREAKIHKKIDPHHRGTSCSQYIDVCSGVYQYKAALLYRRYYLYHCRWQQLLQSRSKCTRLELQAAPILSQVDLNLRLIEIYTLFSRYTKLLCYAYISLTVSLYE